jgi:hypothetical protein
VWRPAFFENVEWPDGAPMVLMSCKALVVDGADSRSGLSWPL